MADIGLVISLQVSEINQLQDDVATLKRELAAAQRIIDANGEALKIAAMEFERAQGVGGKLEVERDEARAEAEALRDAGSAGHR